MNRQRSVVHHARQAIGHVEKKERMTASVDYELIDADNHYYEPRDCFSEYMEPRYQDLAFRSERRSDGSERCVVADHEFTYLEDPFAPYQVKPGALAQMLRRRYAGVDDATPDGRTALPDYETSDVF